MKMKKTTASSFKTVDISHFGVGDVLTLDGESVPLKLRNAAYFRVIAIKDGSIELSPPYKDVECKTLFTDPFTIR